MKQDFHAFQQQKYFAGLDGLRAIAIIGVVWHHSVRPDFLPMFTRGFAGVDLFFVLSGFLITTLLIREKSKHGRISLRNFWARRFLRLMPAYYGLLFAMLAAYVIFKPGDPDTARLVEGFPIYALYLSNWIQPEANNLGITWSLATEEQFYLIWPLIEALAAPVLAGGFWIAALIVNQLINFGVLDPAIDSVFGPGVSQRREILDATFTPILLGVGLAHLLARERWFRLTAQITGFRYAPFVFAGLLLVLMNIPASDISGVFRLTMHILMTAWIASIVLQPGSAITATLEWRPIVFIGAVSYGMYLYHMWCVHIARVIIEKTGLAPLWFEFPLALAGTVVVAGLSFYFYEKPFLSLRSKFRKPKGSPKGPTETKRPAATFAKPGA
ncbi:acyltransferase family protein [Hyphococcus sp.]|uniref:acyltransferase family protein n=1 Tax=Hyphococcus sp. TaxID=2038636 RepID=UPI003CCC4647